MSEFKRIYFNALKLSPHEKSSRLTPEDVKLLRAEGVIFMREDIHQLGGYIRRD